jgi:hypothetical protein
VTVLAKVSDFLNVNAMTGVARVGRGSPAGISRRVLSHYQVIVID